jgi:transketolase
LIPALEKSGFPTPPDVLDYAPLPQSLVQKWKQAIQAKQAQPPPVPPEIQKAKIQAQTEQVKLQAQMQRDAQLMQFNQWKAQLDAQLEQYKTLMKAQTDAQDRQIRAAIDEQSQLVNAQAAEQKALADTLKAKIDGMAKLIDATAKVRMSAEKEISAARQANVIELRQSNPAGDMAAAAVREMAGAIAQLEASLNKPRAPLRVIRDAQGNIAGVE